MLGWLALAGMPLSSSGQGPRESMSVFTVSCARHRENLPGLLDGESLT